MDKYIGSTELTEVIERRARIRLARFKRCAEIGNISWVCRQFGIRHKLIPIARLKQNGKVERSHRTDDEEFYNQRGFRKPAKRRRELAHHMDYYNNQRPHSALGWMTPLEKLRSFPEYQGVTHV